MVNEKDYCYVITFEMNKGVFLFLFQIKSNEEKLSDYPLGSGRGRGLRSQ